MTRNQLVLPLGGGMKPPPQFLKWIGNKQRFAHSIASLLPRPANRYIEPFVGSGAVLGAMGPNRGLASDALRPLIELWNLLKNEPETILHHYGSLVRAYAVDPVETYNAALASFNRQQNPLDLLFLSRTCYGGVVRFTKSGTMSTPRGPHKPISVEKLAHRVALWRERVANTEFVCTDFEITMDSAVSGDVIYCDPPYVYSQSILYGAQAFSLERLWHTIARCKERGAFVALSIDGSKKSGSFQADLNIPDGLFERELVVNVGKSMLRRFQLAGEELSGEDVRDRLLLTY